MTDTKPYYHCADGCGWRGTDATPDPFNPSGPLCCPECNHEVTQIATYSEGKDTVVCAPAPSVEVAPGVFVSADGSARGPMLETALALYADLMTVGDWGRAKAGRTVTLLYVPELEAWRLYLRDAESPDVVWASSHTRHLGEGDQYPFECFRAVADAIRNGRVKP